MFQCSHSQALRPYKLKYITSSASISSLLSFPNLFHKPACVFFCTQLVPVVNSASRRKAGISNYTAIAAWQLDKLLDYLKNIIEPILARRITAPIDQRYLWILQQVVARLKIFSNIALWMLIQHAYAVVLNEKRMFSLALMNIWGGELITKLRSNSFISTLVRKADLCWLLIFLSCFLQIAQLPLVHSVFLLFYF